MPGTIILKPVQANLLNDNDLFTKMDTYCTVLHGPQEINGKVCKTGGKQPHWSDNIIFKRAYEPSCLLKIMNKEWLKKDSVVGTVEINLQEIESKGKMSRWYQLSQDNQPVGEIFIESMFAPDSSGAYKQAPYQQSYTQSTSPYKEYGRNLYPDDIYSPAKQESYEHRRISQMPLSQIPGLEYTHQITFPHISHHLTPQEYQKLHSRQEERYHPTTKVVRDQTAPPSWAGYELYAVNHSPAKLQENSVGSTAGDTPENMKEVVPESPKVISYYPILGGVTYAPSRAGKSYKPSYDKLKNSPIQEKQKSIMEEFDAVADENNGNVGNVNAHTLETTAV